MDHDQDEVRGHGDSQQVRHPLRPDLVDEGNRRRAVAARDRHRRRGRSSEARQVSKRRLPDQTVGEPGRSEALAAVGRAYGRDPGRAWLRQGRDLGDARRKGRLSRVSVNGSGRARRGRSRDFLGGMDPMAYDKASVRKVLDKAKAEGRTALTAPEGKLVCDAYGITVPKEGLAGSAQDAAKLAQGMGFPVVMKIVSPDILHKTEAGGVVVGVKSGAEAEAAYETILGNARKYKIDGVQVQQMVTGGQEVIIGAVTDQSFGKLVAFGLGGVLVEVLKDITFRL